ncbi:MAG: 50S ribosomal protein L13 [Gammaproteobacteria bacterium]|jgi:large subunit ribosomal protein L13|nr:50S ribosomal protein L13 [Gammaproteobacteria bacterium]|tara:strand:+ start:239 stop:673 length:435 start_codon:yes stop_codon:yes gene_type:complete
MKTQSLRKEDSQHDWYIVDASNMVLGRLATKLADRLRGKDKSTFTPHTDGGDYVVVINAEKVKVTGNKFNNKKYYTHSSYPGGLKIKIFKDLIKTKPEYIIEKAVKGMLPKNKLGKQIFKKLKVYKGSEHPHESQQPQIWEPKI